jgi:hypothetical protein
MGKSGGSFKRILLLLVFLALVAVVFVLLGGGHWLKSAGQWMGGVGSKADTMKQDIEHKAQTVEKTVEKGIEAVKGDKKEGDKK